jgi:CheY-like chemotaxis protein
VASPRRRSPPPRVLIVDDIEDNRRIYAMFLEFSGFVVTSAANGHEALARARALRPDVIVMDLALPGLDGWETTRRLRRDRRTRDIPVIALTGHVLPGAEEEARAAGCDHFLTKPCLPEVLAAEIRRALRRPPASRRRDR